jgi:hypothetical protein
MDEAAAALWRIGCEEAEAPVHGAGVQSITCSVAISTVRRPSMRARKDKAAAK